MLVHFKETFIAGIAYLYTDLQLTVKCSIRNKQWTEVELLCKVECVWCFIVKRNASTVTHYAL